MTPAGLAGKILQGVIMKKKIITLVLSIAVLTVGVVAALGYSLPAAANQNHPSDIVGVWEVNAEAPYAPHLFTFHQDGTMTTTNPTNVQENPLKPHGGTNDSLGMGVWEVKKIGHDRVVVGTFEQLNAFADDHQPTDKLSVSFKVKVTDNGEGFDGPAVAKVGPEVNGSHLTGVRVNIDYPAVNGLSF